MQQRRRPRSPRRLARTFTYHVCNQAVSTKTVFDDGSFTQTLYGVSGNPVPGYEVAIPAGGSEKVEIAQRKAQRKAGDAMVVTLYVSDASGNLTDVYQPAVADPNNGGALTRPHTSYVYDQSGDEILQVTADEQAAFQAWVSSEHSTASFSGGTAFTFDQNGDQLTRTLPDGEQESSTYNVYNQVATHTDFDGNTATYSYFPATDPHAGALQQVVYAGSGKATQTVTYVLDDMGRQHEITDASGTTTISYDPEGDVIEQDTPEGIIHHAFDPATGELIETWTAYTDIACGYNDLGELTTTKVKELNGVVLKDSQGADAPLGTTHTYDPAGNKSTETLPNGVVTSWTDDDLNRLVGMNEMLGTTVLFSQSFTLNHDGTRASTLQRQLQPDGTSITTNTVWSNDALGRLTQEALTNDSNAGLSYTDQFTYDLVGNRLQSQQAGPGNGANETINNTYNGDDELTKEVDVVSGVSTETDLAYDANGSLTTSGPPSGPPAETYTYDMRNKMVSADVNGATTTYVYDDAGNRVGETTGGATPFYLTDEPNPTGYAQPIEQKASAAAAPTITYIIGDRVLAQADATGAVSYLLTDGHGSTRALTNSAGAVTATFNYTAFGGALGFNPSAAGTSILYTGQQFDAGASLYYLRARDYAPMAGTFSSRDSRLAAPGDLANSNLYIYVGANATNMVDPTGHDGEVSSTLATLGLATALSLILVGAGASQAISHIRGPGFGLNVIGGIEDLLSTGNAEAVTAATIMLSNTTIVTAAVNRALSRAASKIASLPAPPKVFPIIRRMGPAIYALDTAALATNRLWFVLDYNGPLSARTVRNRSIVWSRWGYLMATAPFGNQLDEFPYASTQQGGAGAVAAPVPWLQNAVQGGLLSAFYRYSLKGVPLTPFLVVPIPL